MDDRIHPELRQAFRALPSMTLGDLAPLREAEAEQLAKTPLLFSPTVRVGNRVVPGPAGAPAVRLRMYTPTATGRSRPAVLWIHGGGYILGRPEFDDDLCQRLVAEADCVVASVDYRLAPENPFPAGLEDCYAALRWLSDHAVEMGVDPARVAIAGSSAGGGLTAALALLARDRGGPAVRFQMPLYPMIDDRNETASSHEITDSRLWNREINLKAWSMYLGSEAPAEVSPYAAPSRATDLRGLPPTYTCVGDHDLFRDEALTYVTRLAAAGVPTEFHLYPGCFHGFEFIAPDADVSRRALDEYVQALRRALHDEPGADPAAAATAPHP